MKKKRVTACLIAGVFILAVSATAAFSSVNGYANYKNAVKALALEADNFTAKANYTMSYDGKELLSGTMEYARDGANYATYNLSKEGDNATFEHRDTMLDGVNRWYNDNYVNGEPMDDTLYYYEHVYESEEEQPDRGSGLLGVANDDEFSRRLVNFLELGADTVVGDLKNNVIELGSRDGVISYQIDVSQNQVPSLVNAGLSLAAYSISESYRNASYVEWENFEKSLFHYYEEKTGQTLSEEFKEKYSAEFPDETWWDENQDEIDAFHEATEDMYMHYYDLSHEKKGDYGVLYVHTDGSYDYYPDMRTYREKTGNGDPNDFRYLIGEDLILKDVHFTFGVDKDNHLTDNAVVATFDTTDQDGGHHELLLKVEANVTDYETTVIQPLDVSGRFNGNING